MSEGIELEDLRVPLTKAPNPNNMGRVFNSPAVAVCSSPLLFLFDDYYLYKNYTIVIVHVVFTKTCFCAIFVSIVALRATTHIYIFYIFFIFVIYIHFADDFLSFLSPLVLFFHVVLLKHLIDCNIPLCSCSK
jgi:hypothetical protein